MPITIQPAVLKYKNGDTYSSADCLKGDKGDVGATPELSIGTVTTGAAGSNASASLSGTTEAPVLNLTIPRGNSGNTTIIAPTFVEGTAYAAGSHVIYSDKYYLLPDGHEANVTWANTTKTEVKVGEEIADLKDGLDDAAMMNDIAAAYDSTATYLKGDICNHDGHFYEANADISIAEAWISAHWNQVLVCDKIVDDTTSLKTAKAPSVFDNASGAIASFADGADGMPIKSLFVDIDPVQDLHGQEAPYPAGGGKNLFENTATSTTSNGVTFTVNSYGTVSCSGTANGTAVLNMPDTHSINTLSENLILSGCPSGGNFDTTYGLIATNNLGARIYGDSGSGVTMTAYASFSKLQIVIRDGTNSTGLVFKPMIRLASVSDATFAPYSNICPISGHSSVTVTRTGVNVWDEETEVGGISATGATETANDRIRSKNYIPVFPETVYYASVGGLTSNDFRLFYYDSGKNFISRSSWMYSGTFTTPSNARFVKFVRTSVTAYANDISINYPATDTTYHTHSIQSIQIPLGQTVYGGTLDVTEGKLTIDRAIVDLGSLTWANNVANLFSAQITGMSTANAEKVICSAYGYETTQFAWDAVASYRDKSISTASNNYVYIKDTSYGNASAFKTAMDGVQLCYDLATPVVVENLTVQQITTLLGVNNIFADTGNVSVDYPADTKLYIDKKLAELQALILENI